MQVKPFQKWLLWASTVLTALTGLVYFWMDRFLEPVDAWAVINHPLQPWVLKAHILVAPVMVFALGMLTTAHIWKLYRARVKRARRTGMATLWVVVPMIATGYLIQAVTQSTVLAIVAWTHIVTGLAFVVGLAAHQWVKGRRKLVHLEVARSGEPARAKDAQPEARPARPRQPAAARAP